MAVLAWAAAETADWLQQQLVNRTAPAINGTSCICQEMLGLPRRVPNTTRTSDIWHGMLALPGTFATHLQSYLDD